MKSKSVNFSASNAKRSVKFASVNENSLHVAFDNNDCLFTFWANSKWSCERHTGLFAIHCVYSSAFYSLMWMHLKHFSVFEFIQQLYLQYSAAILMLFNIQIDFIQCLHWWYSTGILRLFNGRINIIQWLHWCFQQTYRYHWSHFELFNSNFHATTLLELFNIHITVIHQQLSRCYLTTTLMSLNYLTFTLCYSTAIYMSSKDHINVI